MAAGEPQSAVARLLGGGRSTVERSVRQQQVTGDLDPKPNPGARRLIGREQHAALPAQLEATPDAPLAEQCATWERDQGRRVSRDTRQRAIARLGWRRKTDAPGPRAGSRRAGSLAEAGGAAGADGAAGHR